MSTQPWYLLPAMPPLTFWCVKCGEDVRVHGCKLRFENNIGVCVCHNPSTSQEDGGAVAGEGKYKGWPQR